MADLLYPCSPHHQHRWALLTSSADGASSPPPIIFISWRLITLQYCSGFAIHWHESAMDLHVFPILNPLSPPSPSHPSGSSQCTSPEHLSHESNLDWWSVSYLIIYLFQCCSLRSSHPQMANKDMKKDAQHHSFSQKCKSKPQWGIITSQSEWLLFKSLQAINAGESVEKREPSYTVGGNAN